MMAHHFRSNRIHPTFKLIFALMIEQLASRNSITLDIHFPDGA